MKVISTRTTTPPPRKTPRRFTVELTEGEADFILGLIESAKPAWGLGKVNNSPLRYARRLRHNFQYMLGQKGEETDSYLHSFGEVYFHNYDDGLNYRG